MTEAEARERAAALLADAGIVLTPAEREQIEVADFGLAQLDQIGLHRIRRRASRGDTQFTPPRRSG